MRFGLLLSILLACRAVAASQARATEDGRHDVAALERALHSRNLADNIWNAIKNAASCTGCQGILFLLKGLALLGDRAFVDSIQDVCKIAKIQDADVCDGAVALEGPIIANVIRHMDLNSPTSERFCATVFGLCQLPSPQPWSVPFPSSKPAITQPTSNRGTPLKVVHYSDIHLDIDYLPGSNTQCTKPICCRAYQPSDSPGNTSNPAGLYGDHKCDPPATLEESMFRAIRDAVPDMSFALFTGDIVAGYIWNTSESYNSASITNGYSPMENYVNIVYGTVGNHEQSPVNAFQPQSVGTNAAWVYDLLSSIWTRWTGSQTANTISQIGAYSTKVPGRNLRIISINTNLYYKMNFWMYQRKMEVDPDGQLTWLVGELDAAEKAGERVYIIGHMPMGTSDAFYDASNYFDQITNRYAGTIAGMFFGHTHADQFQISYANYSDQSFSNAVAMSYIAPSVTPTFGMPAFRVYSVDPDTFGVLDVVQYIADMKNPAFQTTGPVWTEYYSAKDVYGPIVQPPVTDTSTELTPAFWHNVTAAFQTNATLFNAYMARKSRGWKAATCTGDCQASEICQLRAARSQDNCVKPVPGVHLNKRSNGGIDSDHATDCGFSMIGDVLGSVGQSKIALDALQEKFVIQKGMT